MTGLRHAATVILVRDQEDCPFEIFFMRRGLNQSFMGGAYVFPGGGLDEGDCDPDLIQCFSPIGGDTDRFFSERLQEPDLEESIALGLHCAAIRETFEEAGVLLALDEVGRTPIFAGPESRGLYAGYRESLHKREMSLQELAARERLHYAPELLIPYAHWITPEIETKRFDTRFFLTLLPEGQNPVHDQSELTASVWMTAAEALSENAAGRIKLMPPTLKTVCELHAFRNTKELLEWVTQCSIQPILPQFFKTDQGGIGLRLPFDPDYSIIGFKLPPRTGEPTRLYIREGIWTIN